MKFYTVVPKKIKQEYVPHCSPKVKVFSVVGRKITIVQAFLLNKYTLFCVSVFNSQGPTFHGQ